MPRGPLKLNSVLMISLVEPLISRRTLNRELVKGVDFTMSKLLSVLILLCFVPSFQAASSKLTCVRSLKCNIQRYQGCYAVKGMCRCAQAWCCNNPFNYSSLQSCLSVAENAVHLVDPCEKEPCKNNGYCVQLKGAKDGYRCECHGTGYYGPRCHKKCPKDVRKAIRMLLKSKVKFAHQRIRHLRLCRL
ncbi:unnamed protein product [Porites lobata]|uniref:EGF-like domain-containing protein n=1 Tax=Porites lobata TaxID=104759 RepID=A0ABN8MZ59_9CNID|nr:unnamed protein product [Porites lobata]